MHPLRIKVKMCGMTRAIDIAYASDLGVDAFGLIFYPESPRFVTMQRAFELCNTIPPFITPVAVLVNPQVAFVHELIRELPIQVLQFHGDETPDFCAQFNKPYIKSIQVQSAQQMQQAMHAYSQASAILYDTHCDTLRGGTGLSFDWSIIPQSLPKPYILAGGLNTDNVREALKVCSPYAIDVCSGIEEKPGIKDHDKMKQLIKILGGN